METFKEFVKAVTDLPSDAVVVITTCEWRCARIMLGWIAGAFEEELVDFDERPAQLNLLSGQKVIFIAKDKDVEWKLRGLHPAFTMHCGEIERLL